MELGPLFLINLILLPEYFSLLKSHLQIESLILKTYASISTTGTRSSEVIDFVVISWNPTFWYAGTMTLGTWALPRLLGEGGVPKPSHRCRGCLFGWAAPLQPSASFCSPGQNQTCSGLTAWLVAAEEHLHLALPLLLRDKDDILSTR